MSKRRFARVAGLASALLVLSTIQSFAQDPPKKMKRLFIQASAQGTSTQLGRMVSINIMINEYSTAEDQQALLQAFQEKGSQGLYHAVDKMKSKGRIAITGTLGFDINYIKLFQMPDGSQKIRFVTDRPILFGEAWSSSRSMDYNLAMGEIILSKQKGKSTGSLVPAAELKLDKEHGLEIEAYQNPWKLENIQLR